MDPRSLHCNPTYSQANPSVKRLILYSRPLECSFYEWPWLLSFCLFSQMDRSDYLWIFCAPCCLRFSHSQNVWSHLTSINEGSAFQTLLLLLLISYTLSSNIDAIWLHILFKFEVQLSERYHWSQNSNDSFLNSFIGTIFEISATLQHRSLYFQCINCSMRLIIEQAEIL